MTPSQIAYFVRKHDGPKEEAIEVVRRMAWHIDACDECQKQLKHSAGDTIGERRSRSYEAFKNE